jgi:hypothetical protein
VHNTQRIGQATGTTVSMDTYEVLGSNGIRFYWARHKVRAPDNRSWAKVCTGPPVPTS